MSCTARGFLTSSPMLIPDTRATYLSFSAEFAHDEMCECRSGWVRVVCAYRHEARTEDGTLELHGNASEDDVIHLEVAVLELDSPDSDDDALRMGREQELDLQCAAGDDRGTPRGLEAKCTRDHKVRRQVDANQGDTTRLVFDDETVLLANVVGTKRRRNDRALAM